MIKTYTSEAEVKAVRIEGDLYDLCEQLEDITGRAHPMWKMPGGFQEGVEPNAVMLKDTHLGWVEADVGDYIIKTPIGPRHVPGHIFDMFFTAQ